MFYGGDTKFNYTTCQWIEAQAGKHIHHEMCRHGGERMVTVGVLNAKGEKELTSFLVDGYEPETNTVYQFHGYHWHRYTCLKNHAKKQELQYKDMCLIDQLIENNGWATEHSLVSTWECEEPILEKVRFEKKFTPYPYFIVYEISTA